jgi:hypothetical protein
VFIVLMAMALSERSSVQLQDNGVPLPHQRVIYTQEYNLRKQENYRIGLTKKLDGMMKN